MMLEDKTLVRDDASSDLLAPADEGSQTMAERIVSFVMSGGVGSRLWPLSREDNPKQFHDLSGDGSMLLKTLKRLASRDSGETPIFLIASEKHAARVQDDLTTVELGGGGAL